MTNKSNEIQNHLKLQTITKMNEITNLSSKNFKLYGFKLCADSNGDIYPSSPVIEGEIDRIDLENSKCPPSTKEVGTFITHPKKNV